ncbi:hypothetical protein GCM10023322_76170 [Rugosimonospora acidiphila]|uniref:WXG100 family type VII secretion target n=1 Tax=Rugosimonospora acidiphila TaxID=556531 RepID=A0ABP9SS90_9ACTN
MADASGSKIAVTDDLANSGASIMAIATQLGDNLTRLTAMLATLQEYWTGQANVTWQDLQTQWNTAAADLMTAPGQLGAISNAASTNWQNYVDTETANVSSWSH